MDYSAYYQPMDYLSTRQAGLSYIRILHALSDGPPVDVYINNRLIARNKAYKTFTPYLGLHAGNYSIIVYSAGSTVNPIINTNVEISPHSIYTGAITGTLNDAELYLITDPVIPTLMNKARVRLVHLSPNAPSVDLTLADGSMQFSNISYKDVTSYKSFNPGRYTLQTRLVGTNEIVLNVPNIVFRPGRILSIYIVGLIGEEPPLQVLIPLDGNSYLTL